MGGPTVIVHGTEEQKQRFLAPILPPTRSGARASPSRESGSDLASLKTRAVRDGDDYVVTGQKVWTTCAHEAKWCMLVARTDPDAPKHRGLTYFLMDMEQDGVEVRPLVRSPARPSSTSCSSRRPGSPTRTSSAARATAGRWRSRR